MKKKITVLLLIATLLAFVLAFTACFLTGKEKDKEEKIKKIPLSEATVYISGTWYYTGEPIEIPYGNITVLTPSNNVTPESLTFEYSDNVEPGEASVKITAKSDNKFVTGSVVEHFTILPAGERVFVTSANDLKARLASRRYAALVVDKDLTIDAGEELTVSAGVHLYVSHTFVSYEENSSVTLINNGKITVEPDGFLVMAGNYSNEAEIINKGTIEVKEEGRFNVGASSYVYNSGTIKAEQGVTNYGGIYTNTPVKNTTSGGASYVQRVEFNEENVVFSDEAIRYDSDVNRNKPDIRIAGEYYYGGRFENNDAVGTATAILEADERDRKYYGNYRKNYTIEKGKTDFTDFEAWKSLKATGNYNEYNFTGYPQLTVTEDFTIDADETLTSKETVAVSSAVTLTNKGLLDINGRVYCYLSVSGEVKNDGRITLEKAAISGNGRFANGSETNAEATVENARIYMEPSGVFVNYGVLAGGEEYSLAFDTLRNEASGIVSAIGMTVKSELKNDGKITTNGLTAQGSVTNAGELVLTGYSFIEGESFANTGKVANTGKIRLYATVAFSNTGTGFNNANGEIWAYETPENVTQNTYLIEDITAEKITLSFTETAYNGENQKPVFRINDELIPEEEIGYLSVTYKNLSKNESTINCIDAARYSITIGQNWWTEEKRFYRFAGSAELEFTILPTTAEVSTATELHSACSNVNYDKIVLASNVEVSGYTSNVVGRSQTLDLNGFRLTVTDNASLTNNGNMIVREIAGKTGIDAVGLYVKKGTSGYNKARFIHSASATLTNAGVVYADTTRTKIELFGDVVNSGSVYLKDSAIQGEIDVLTGGVTGTGNVYRRADMRNAEDNVTLAYGTVDYSGEAKEPVVTITDGTNTLLTSDYDVVYENNTNAGQATVRVSVKSDDIFNPYYFGSVVKNFTIERIAMIIDSTTLPSGNLTTEFFTDYSSENYESYTLGRDVTLWGTVELPDGVLFDVGSYTIGFNGNRLKLGENTELYVTVSNIADFKKYRYAATKITLNADIGEELVYDSSTKTYNENGRIAYDYDKTTDYNGTYFANIDAYNVFIDLNGHSFPGQIFIKHSAGYEVNIEIVNSSDVQSTLGTNNGYFAIEQGWYNGDSSAKLNLTLNGNNKLLVYGLSWAGLANGISTVEATGCSFRVKEEVLNRNGNKIYMRAIDMGSSSHAQRPDKLQCSFTNCTFRGYTGVRVGCGAYEFTDCTITSTGTHYFSGSGYDYVRGDAMILWQSVGSSSGAKTLVVNMSNCRLNSTSGYGIVLLIGSSKTQVVGEYWELNRTNVTYDTTEGTFVTSTTLNNQ